jgi:OOP family OmpA-OmpF porin
LPRAIGVYRNLKEGIMKKIVIVSIVSAFAATPALADNTGHFYMAADLGSASYSNVTVGAGTYPNPGMIRIAGGYHFSPIFAAEVGYSRFGDSTITAGTASGTVSASSAQAALVGSLPLTPQFDLIGKIGVASNKHKIDATSSGVTVVSMSSSQNDLLIGLGAQYNFNSQLSMRAQYESFGKFGDFGTTGVAMKASALSVGVAYNF